MTAIDLIRRLHKDQSGQDLLEYALVLATVLVAVVAGSNSVANLLGNGINTLSAKIQNIVH